MGLYDSLMERMEGREYTGYFACLCPFHDDHKPSMMVYEDKAYCKTCNRYWSLKQVEQKIGSHYHPQRNNTVSNILPNWRRWEFEYGDLQGIAEHAHQMLIKYPQFQGYLKKRRCNEFIEKGFLGYLDGWITVPVYSGTDKMVDMVVRGVKKGETRYVVKPHKNAPRPIYVPNRGILESSEQIYVVYGILDAVGLSLMGFPVITGMTGKSLNAELLAPLRKKLVIIPDAGEEREAHLLANSLGWRAKVKELDYPIGTKDCAGVREMYGDEVLRDLIYM